MKYVAGSHRWHRMFRPQNFDPTNIDEAIINRLQPYLKLKTFTPAEMETLRRRCASAAGDGHLELYKSTMKYDGDVGRQQHGLPPHKELPL